MFNFDFHCSECGAWITADHLEWQPADPEVGIVQGYVEGTDDMECPHCHYINKDEEIERKAFRWYTNVRC